jgi:hypothetical protein
MERISKDGIGSRSGLEQKIFKVALLLLGAEQPSAIHRIKRLCSAPLKSYSQDLVVAS